MDAAAINSMAAKIRGMAAIMEKSITFNRHQGRKRDRTQRVFGGSTVPPAILLHVPFGT